MFGKRIYDFIYCFVLVVVTAALCGWLNRVGMDSFYHDIKLSPLTPPDAVFPIIWGVLYIMLIASLFMVLESDDKEKVRSAAQIFTLNMFLHVLWTFAFFYRAYFLLGFAVLVVLDFSAFLMLKIFYDLRKSAGLMLVPYTAWLLFATYLNRIVTDLNGAYL